MEFWRIGVLDCSGLRREEAADVESDIQKSENVVRHFHPYPSTP